MSSRTNRATWPAAVGILLALAACTDEGPEPVRTETLPPPVVSEPSEVPTTAAPGTASPDSPTDGPVAPPTAEETDPAALPPFEPAGTPRTAEASGEPLLPVAVRTGEHAGFGRVVVELAGDGVPGWRIEYVDRAVEDGRGEEVDVDGEAILGVHITGTRYPEEGEDHPARQVVEGGDVIEEVHFLGTFEGLTQLFVGVDDGVADYRVFVLADPARVVIDIEDPDI